MTRPVTGKEFAERDVVDALAGDARWGVACRVMMIADRQRDAAFRQMEDARCQVHLYPDTSQALYMHCEKQIITDGTRVLIGSQNASVASLVYNRELSLQVTAAQALTLVRSVTATFNYDYVKAAAIGLSQPGRREVASAGFDSR